MADPRVAKLARVLVQHSLNLQPGQLFRITGPHLAAPLMRELTREALLVGAHPFTRVTLEEVEEAFYKTASDAQLRHLPELMRKEIESIDATVSILLEQIGQHEVQRRAAVLPARLVVRGSARLPQEPRLPQDSRLPQA